MEKLKGLLKRRSGETRSSPSTIFSEMEVVSDPENTEEIRANNCNLDDYAHPQQDNTYALMMGKIESLTMENYSIENRLSDLTLQVESKTQENLELQSKCDDLLKSLELEKRRFRWQQKFYEKRIQQLTGIPTTPTIPSNTSDEEPLNPMRHCQSLEDLVECNAFYEDTIKALVIVQENQNGEMRTLRKFYEDKLKSLSLEHEVDVSEILESHNYQVQKLIMENESVIRDLLTGCEGLFDDLKVEYNLQVRENGALQTNSGQNIVTQFKALSPLVRGIVIAGITVISIATAGWASWGFIIWVWPRLIAFAEVLATSPETFAYLLAFLNSVPFQSFIKSWEEGKSLAECLKSFANTEFLSSALHMAPDLFKQFKQFPRPMAH